MNYRSDVDETARRLNVLIWRTEWLSYSETFIELQARNLNDSRATYAGLSTNENGERLGATAIVGSGKFLGRIERFLFSRFGFSPKLRSLIDNLNIDVVHAHFGPDAISIHQFCRRNSLPLVITLHGYDVSASATGLDSQSRAYRRKLKSAMQFASNNLCVSEHIRNLAIALGAPNEKTNVHHVGVEIPSELPESSMRSGLLFVGRLVEKKGLDDLLVALSMLAPPLRETRLTVIGRGPMLQELTDTARSLGLNVDFRGSLDHTEVLREISTAEIVVVPSKQAHGGDVEGLPTVLMEAMARSIPVVGTQHSGIPEAIRSGIDGLLSQERDPGSLAANLERLLTDERELHLMGLSGRERAEELFNVSTQSRLLDSVYAEAADGQVRQSGG